MEIIYPDNFIRFFNDEEVDDVGEYEIALEDNDFEMIPSQFSNYPEDNEGLFVDYSNDFIADSRSFFPPDWKKPSQTTPSTSTNKPATNKPASPIPKPNINFPSWNMPPWLKPTNYIPHFHVPNSETPIGPPPLYVPSKTDKGVVKLSPEGLYGSPIGVQNISDNSIRFCLYKFTYIWQSNGRSYWAYLINVDRRSISGFRWIGWRWFYFGVDLRKIDSFICY